MSGQFDRIHPSGDLRVPPPPPSPSNSQIVPYVVADNARAMRLASALKAPGFDIR